LKKKLRLVPAENKQDMSDTSITLPWSAISSIGLFPIDIYIYRLMGISKWSAWTREGLPAEGTPKLKSAKSLRKSNLV